MSAPLKFILKSEILTENRNHEKTLRRVGFSYADLEFINF